MTGDTTRARISVAGRIDTGDSKPDMIRAEYAGAFTELDHGFMLEYDETEPPAHVALSFTGDMALLERAGEPNSRMEFVPGSTRDALYAVSEGEFDLATECSALSAEQHPRHGRLRIAYRLLSAGALVSDNRLLVTYTLC